MAQVNRSTCTDLGQEETPQQLHRRSLPLVLFFSFPFPLWSSSSAATVVLAELAWPFDETFLLIRRMIGPSLSRSGAKTQIQQIVFSRRVKWCLGV